MITRRATAIAALSATAIVALAGCGGHPDHAAVVVAGTPDASTAGASTATPCVPVAPGTRAYAAYKECLIEAGRRMLPAVVAPPKPTIPVPAFTSCPDRASELSAVPVEPVTPDNSTFRMPGARTFMAFTVGAFHYMVWAGIATYKDDRGYVHEQNRGAVYLLRLAVDPCAQFGASEGPDPEAWDLDAIAGAGLITLTGHHGTTVSFTRAHGPAGHLDVATGTWS